MVHMFLLMDLTIVVGAPHENTFGSVFVYGYIGGVLSSITKIFASDKGSGGRFCYSIAVDGKVFVACAFHDDSSCESMYIFDKTSK